MTAEANVLNHFGQAGSENSIPKDNIYHGDGTNIIAMLGDPLKTGAYKMYGSYKIDTRPVGGTTADYGLQLRLESGKTSGTQWGLDGETHMKANGTASMRGVQGVSVLDSTYTATSATYIGTYGQVRADGTFTGSGFMAALYGLVEASAAITASHVCSQWLDSHQANTVTGSHQLAYWTNNGAAVMDQALYLYGGNSITAFAEFDTCGGMVSDGAAVGATVKKIKITVDGATFYLNALTLS
jgi:hypothetical protein